MSSKRERGVERPAGAVAVVGMVVVGLVWALGSARAWNGVTAGGMTAVQPGGWVNPSVPPPTGSWTGPPEIVDGPHMVGAPHGGTIFYWNMRGIKGALPGMSNTLVLATDDWRWRTSFRRWEDTIELTATNGQRFRRQGTPVYGVVAVVAPDVDAQAADVDDVLTANGSLRMPDGTIFPLVVNVESWKAEKVTILDASGRGTEVAGVPKWPSSTIGRIWHRAPGDARPDASVMAESVLADGTFEIRVAGYSDDLAGRSVFVYPQGDTTPDTSILLLTGASFFRALTVSLGSDSGVTNNGAAQIQQPAGPNAFMPVEPGPDPVVLRYAILYVPGDTVYLAEEADAGAGGK
jgi:hypothetical protein